jgi:hypothetical protein
MLKNKLTLNKLIHKFTEKRHYLCQSKTSNELDIVSTQIDIFTLYGKDQITGR